MDTEKKCTGDCLQCSFAKQNYCAAQRSFAIMQQQAAIISAIERIERALAAMPGAAAAADLITPLAPVAGGLAQIGPGAEE